MVLIGTLIGSYGAPVAMSWHTVGSGYGLVESPKWLLGQGIAFSDVIAGGVYLTADDGTTTTVVPKRRGVGGIAVHAEGGVLVTGRSLQHVRHGVTRVVLDEWPARGYNDLGAAPNGAVVIGTFSGSTGDLSDTRTRNPALLLAPHQQPREVLGGLAFANGVAFSVDGTRCYVADSVDRVVRWVDFDDGAAVKSSGVLIELETGRPDGIAVDSDDGVWVTCYGAGLIVRVTTDGSITHRLAVPVDEVACVAFAGDDCADLVVGTASADGADKPGGLLLRGPSPVPGLLPNLARI